ncbi:MAG: phosphate signaling complex protein PhoU [Verrucomicrobiales bacterium]|nr:phosphate signaling complex protein PhoU [Verrucomicrobiales bacterium]
MHDHILSTFDRSLAQLRDKLLVMASITRKNLDGAMRGLLQRDLALCNESIAADEEVNELNKAIDHLGMDILVKFQPAAHDLREVMGSIRVASNLERISDQAGSIAKRARHLNQLPELPELNQIQPLCELCMQNLDAAIAAFRDGDSAQAEATRAKDKELDAAEKAFGREMLDSMEEGRQKLEGCLHLIFVARMLERVGDHGKNICEDTIFIEDAKDIRFRKNKRLRQDASAS